MNAYQIHLFKIMREWLVAAIGTLFAFGSSTGPLLYEKGRPPMNERPASSSRPLREGAQRDVDIACVKAAVAARENSLSSAASTQSQAVAAAYTTRAAALDAAYSASDPKTVKQNSKKAWDEFSKIVKGAKQTWQRSKENSWKTFKDAVKACKGSENITDASGISMEQ